MSRNKIRGMAGYGELLYQLQQKPRTKSQVSADLGCTEMTAFRLVRLLWEAHLLYIIRWDPAIKGPESAVYAYGDLPDAPHPRNRQPVRRTRPAPGRVRVGVQAFIVLMRALKDGATRIELTDLGCGERGSVYCAVKRLHDRKMVRIGSYTRGRESGNWEPVFVLGEGPDAPKPRLIKHRESDKARRRKDRALQSQMALLRALHGKSPANDEREKAA